MSSDAVTGLHRPALLRSMLQILIDRLLLGANCPRGVHKISQDASAARQNFSYDEMDARTNATGVPGHSLARSE